LKNEKEIALWDPFVRVFHWSLASAFLLNYWVTEGGDEIHEWLGYTALVLVLARVVWGFGNTGAARWAAFWPTRTRLAAHWSEIRSGEPHRKLGHSAFGAVVMIGMMGGMLLLGILGFAMEEIDYFWGDDRLESIHESIADVVAVLTAIHLGGALVQSFWLRENLPLSMITGRRRRPDSERTEDPNH
jgi:cytochrome b